MSVKLSASKKAVGVDVDSDPDLWAPFDFGEPVADDVLDVEASSGMDEEPLAVAAAEHGERGGGGAEYRHAFDRGRGVADAAGDPFRFRGILGGNDDRGEATEGRHCGLPPGFGLRGIEAGRVA